MMYVNRGPLSVDRATAKRLIHRLTVRGSDFLGKMYEYWVFREQGERVLIPRYILGIKALIEAARVKPQLCSAAQLPMPAVPLWKEQEAGVDRACDVLRRELGVFLNALPGAGKTVAALHIAQRLNPRKVLVLVDQDNLIEQWTERIKTVLPGVNVTYIKPVDEQAYFHRKFGQRHLIPGIQKHDLRGRFVICSTQTLARHPYPIETDLLIVDECHVFSAPTFCQAIFNVTFKWSIGLSANTTRADHLEWIFKNMLGVTTVTMEGRREPARAFFYPVSTSYLHWDEPYPNHKSEDFKVLWCKWHKKMTTSYDCTACPTAKKVGSFDASVLSEVAGCVSFWRHDEYDENSLERHLSASPKYTAWVLDTVNTLLKDKRNVMLFTRLREPLEYYHKLINLEFGPVSGLYLGAANTAADRHRNESALKKPITLCTYKKAGKGLDVAEKDAIVFASPVSTGQLNQVLGRVERALEGKRQPVAIHAVIPFVTSVARMRGCIRWYMEHNYEVTVSPILARHAGVSGHQGREQSRPEVRNYHS